MTASRVFALLLVALGLGLAGYLTTADAQPASGSNSAVAVVDVKQVFEQLAEKNYIQAELQSRTDKFNTERAERGKALEALRADVDVLPPDSEARKTRIKELEEKSIEFQAWVIYHTQDINRQRIEQTERLYNKIIESVGKLASERGFDIALVKEKDLQIPSNIKPEQVSALLEMRKVLWNSDKNDITQPVIQYMNAQFNAGRP